MSSGKKRKQTRRPARNDTEQPSNHDNLEESDEETQPRQSVGEKEDQPSTLHQEEAVSTSESDEEDPDKTVSARDMQARIEMKRQQERNKRVMKDKDLQSRLNNIVIHTIWPRMKYCDLDSGFGEQYRKILEKEMPDKTAESIKKDWKKIKAVTNQCLRSRRSYVNQMMKGNYFGAYSSCVVLLFCCF